MTLDTAIIITCAIIALALYIYLKVTSTVWYGINWTLVWKYIRKLFR